MRIIKNMYYIHIFPHETCPRKKNSKLQNTHIRQNLFVVFMKVGAFYSIGIQMDILSPLELSLEKKWLSKFLLLQRIIMTALLIVSLTEQKHFDVF